MKRQTPHMSTQVLALCERLEIVKFKNFGHITFLPGTNFNDGIEA